MLEPLKITPPPQVVKHTVPRLGNDTHKKAPDFDTGVIAVLTTRWRVVICKKWQLVDFAQANGGTLA